MCHTLDPLGGRGKGVAFGWCHEVKRVFMEGLCRMSDLEWIEGRINILGNKVRMSTYFGVSTRCLACVLEFKGQSLQSLKKKKCDRQRGPLTVVPCLSLSQFLSLSDGGEKGPLALSAIPTEIRQGEEHPVSTVSPLSMLPEVRTTTIPLAPETFTPHSLCHSHSKAY